MEHESADPRSENWSEPRYPTEEEIASLPPYVHPATRWSLAFISLVAGCVAAGLSIMRLAGDRLLPPLVRHPAEVPVSHAAAWVGLISGLCWMAAGITISRGRLVGTGIWFALGVITGLVGTFL